jgi:hypothetical protein
MPTLEALQNGKMPTGKCQLLLNGLAQRNLEGQCRACGDRTAQQSLSHDGHRGLCRQRLCSLGASGLLNLHLVICSTQQLQQTAAQSVCSLGNGSLSRILS